VAKLSETLISFQRHVDVWEALGIAEREMPHIKKTAAWALVLADAEMRLDRARGALTDEDMYYLWGLDQ
jgi:hypothetical protein